MVATSSTSRCRIAAVVASVVSVLLLILVVTSVLTAAGRKSNKSQPKARFQDEGASFSDSAHICRVYAVDVLMADQFGNLRGDDGADFFECELVLLGTSSAGDKDSKHSDNIMMVEDIYFTVQFSKSVVMANAAALEHDQWFVQYHPEWVVRGKTLVFPSDESVVSVRPDQVERRLTAQKSTITADRSSNSGVRRANSDSDEHSLPTFHYPYDVRRRLVSKEARNKIIIVRITTADRDVVYSADELANFVFGATDSLQAQYYACSQGTVDYVPYDPARPVFEVTVENGVDDYTFDGIFREANPLVKQMVGGTPLGDLVEHVMYVVPTGLGSNLGGQGADGAADFEAVSVASLNHFKQMYIDRYFSQIGALLHQTAHNKGLGHAWQGDDEYGDTTGAMGKGEPGVEKVCFNGLHANHLEWMTDKTVRVDGMAQETRIELISYVDYDVGFDEQAVILIVEPFYLTYNLKKGFNSETLEFEDEVLIVRREFRSADSIATNLVAHLHPNKTSLFTEEAFFTSGESLTIEVCEVKVATPSRPDSIIVAVGTEANPCTPVPSAMPSVSTAPTPAPAPPVQRPAGAIIPIYSKESNNFIVDASACEDSLNVMFFMNDTLGRQRCSWLRQNRNGMHDRYRTNKEAFCVESHDAYHFCEEECGKCTDDCNDDSIATFMLAGSKVNCEWLSTRPFLWTLGCKHEEISFFCKETCETCL
jgi:hypothetical protein